MPKQFMGGSPSGSRANCASTASATSGAALSQYLIWARYAVDQYHATAVVINVVGNDFDESLAAYGVKTGFWLYDGADEQGVLRLRLFEYRPVPFTGLTARSALARYLLFNLQLGPVWTAVKSFSFGAPALAEPRYAGNTLAEASEVRLRELVCCDRCLFPRSSQARPAAA